MFLGDRSLTFPTCKTLALLVYLALEGGQQPRDLLSALLWPESNQERSYASLRNTLGHLRSALSEARELAQSSYLSVTHNALALNPDADILVDLKMVERAYVQASADRSSRSALEDARRRLDGLWSGAPAETSPVVRDVLQPGCVPDWGPIGTCRFREGKVRIPGG